MGLEGTTNDEKRQLWPFPVIDRKHINKSLLYLRGGHVLNEEAFFNALRSNHLLGASWHDLR